MLSKLFKPQYNRVIKTSIKSFSTTFEFGDKGKEKGEKLAQEQAEKQYKEQKQQEQQQHNEEYYDNEEDFEQQQLEQEPIWKRALKWSAFLSVCSIFYVNGKIANDCDYDQQLASQNKLYIWPIYTISAYFAKNIVQGYEYILYPPLKKFLPDELPLNPQLMRKTLVLNFEGTMYSKDMKTGQGLVLHLRPGFRKFLKQMAQKYEIVIFSKEDMNFLSEVIKTIDPNQMYFPFFFGNEFLAQQVNGKMLKDLRYLNRNPRRTVVVDFDENIYKNAQYNVLYLEKYDGQENDNNLKKLSYFLEYLSKPEISDVRKEIKKYGGFSEAVNNYKSGIDEKYEKIKQKSSFFTKKFVGINKRQM